MMRLPLPKQEVKPNTPKFPTADFAHDMAAMVAKGRKKKTKKKGNKLSDIDLEV